MKTADSFLDDLRKARPDPGGGSASAHGALMAAFLAEKIARLERNRAHASPNDEVFWNEILEQLQSLSDNFTRLRDQDIDVYEQLARAIKTGSSVNRAAEEACMVPLAIMEEALGALDLVKNLALRCKPILVPDALVSIELLGAAIRSAFHIGMSNMLLIEETAPRMRLMHIFSERIEAAGAAIESVRKKIAKYP